MPMRIGVSPRAAMMNGDATCRTPAAAAPLSTVRRSNGRWAIGNVIGFLRKAGLEPSSICPLAGARGGSTHIGRADLQRQGPEWLRADIGRRRPEAGAVAPLVAGLRGLWGAPRPGGWVSLPAPGPGPQDTQPILCL